MAMRFAGSLSSITAEETVLKDTDTPITIVIDKFNYVFLTLEQTRSLWSELGAVLQSLDHDAGVEDAALADDGSFHHHRARQDGRAFCDRGTGVDQGLRGDPRGKSRGLVEVLQE